ncbi:response regulator transcription factor [Pedobacter glucosidilyticus]|uniref:response regulator transcription factor n=1 Tax=Pedobacter glucosidilyticus TaxID=1122941 RepID=UPI000479FCF9|nr:response regulator [Pedobacter glucosidilyticus]
MARILLVEDEELMLKALEFRLKKDEHEVEIAKDGREALLKIQSADFDLIITDIMLPFVSGLEIIGKVKQTPHLAKTPMIVLSAVGLENVVLEAFELGVDDFITKPFNLTELTIRVKKLLKK